jgi:uncharacterized damage-inducible protein DinB
MNAKEPIRFALESTQNLLNCYVGDLSDEDLAVRPVPKANNIAWQLGHLISAESYFIKAAFPAATYPELPATFRDNYSNKAAATTPPGGYMKKAELLDWFVKVRAATLANLDKATEADLEKKTTGDMAKFAPTLAALFILTANHTLMHAGQFSVTRRALSKPVLF